MVSLRDSLVCWLCLLFMGLHDFTAAAKNPDAALVYDQAKIVLPNQTVIQADVADTTEKRTLGLGYRTHLPNDRGMLFIFESKQKHGFWMKNMLIPIDIIWLNNYRIVHIEASVPPPSAPDQLPVYKPEQEANFVLEIAAGQAKALGLKTGQTLKYQLDY